MPDILDTRDLLDERDALLDEADEEPCSEEDAARLAALEDLLSEIGEDCARDGVALIPESGFEDYARELAEDIGAIDRDAGWPCYCIDWARAARELAMDYSSVTFDGTDYYWRG